MMLEFIYIGIATIVLILSIKDLFNEGDWKKQLTHLIVIIPLLLRVFLIK